MLVINPNIKQVFDSCTENGYVLVTGSLEAMVAKLVSLKRASLGAPVVLGDINPRIVGNSIERALLRVLEDITIDLMVVSSQDSFSDIFVSRFARVVKNVPVYKNRYNSVKAFVDIASDKNHPAPLRAIIEEAPKYTELYLRYVLSPVPAKRKLLELLT